MLALNPSGGGSKTQNGRLRSKIALHLNRLQSATKLLCAKTQRLYFLKQVSRAGVPQDHLFHFYTGVIRPVPEYAAPVGLESLAHENTN